METFAYPSRSYVIHIVVGIMLAFLYGLFAYRHVSKFIVTGQIVFLIFCFSETLQMAFSLMRNFPKSVSHNTADWLIAVSCTLAPTLFQPNGIVISQAGAFFVLFGAVIQICGLIALNRSFAIVPALRQIKTGGLYRIVRHPIYASYVLTFTGYLLLSATAANLSVLVFVLIAMLLRIVREEQHLVSDPDYVVYMQKVPHRLIPFLY